MPKGCLIKGAELKNICNQKLRRGFVAQMQYFVFLTFNSFSGVQSISWKMDPIPLSRAKVDSPCETP